MHALLCLATAEGGMSLIVLVSLQHVRDTLQRQRPHAPKPWEDHAQRWLRVEDSVPTHFVGQAHRGQVVVLEGTGFWACVWVEQGGLDWIVVTADRLVRQQSKGSACFGVLRDHLRFMGPVSRAQRCLPGSFPPAPVVFVEVTTELLIPGQDVWPVVPSNMWQPEQVAIMCAALLVHAAALSRVPAAQPSSNRLPATMAMLHGGPRAWCWVIVAMGPHSSALRMYDRGGVPELAIHPADLEALHLGTLSGDGGTALFLQGNLGGCSGAPVLQALWRRRLGDPKTAFWGGGGDGMGARRKRGGVPEMGFRAGPFVLYKDGCCHQRRQNTNFGPEKVFLRKHFPPHMCSQNDQRDVGNILSHVCWGRTSLPAPGTVGRAARAQTPLPARRPRRAGGCANGLPCHPLTPRGQGSPPGKLLPSCSTSGR